jgi:glutathione S-transferase
MELTLYYHPLASFCWKVLIALYENETPFTAQLIDLADATSRAELERNWPIAKFPVLHDLANSEIVPESTIIVEYLMQHYPGRAQLIPRDPDRAREARLRDRFFDLYVHEPMQKIVGDRLRPANERDRYGVNQARALLATAYAMIDREMRTRVWAVADEFSLADCAVMPALYYGNRVAPIAADHAATLSYLDRLLARASCARVIREAEPYFAMFPA